MQNPLVAIIIPIYNVKDYLKECLDSVLNQSYQNLQIILVDDASTDGSFEIAKEYFQKDLRVSLLAHKQNLGLSAARNLGLNYLSSLTSKEWGGGQNQFFIPILIPLNIPLNIFTFWIVMTICL